MSKRARLNITLPTSVIEAVQKRADDQNRKLSWQIEYELGLQNHRTPKAPVTVAPQVSNFDDDDDFMVE